MKNTKLPGRKKYAAKTHLHGEFNTPKGKAYIVKRNVVYVLIKEDAPRHKIVIMADKTVYIFRNYSLLEIKEECPHLLQPNQRELVSPDIIIYREYHDLTLKLPNGSDKKLIISDTYFHDFLRGLKNS